MFSKKILLPTVAVAAVLAVLECLIHGKLLMGLYEQTAAVWRPEGHMQSLSWMMWVSYPLFAFLFVAIYSKGVESGKSAVGQGLRFGLLVGALLALPSIFVWYVVLPIPQILALNWFLASLVEGITCGVVAAVCYEKVA